MAKTRPISPLTKARRRAQAEHRRAELFAVQVRDLQRQLGLAQMEQRASAVHENAARVLERLQLEMANLLADESDHLSADLKQRILSLTYYGYVFSRASFGALQPPVSEHG